MRKFPIEHTHFLIQSGNILMNRATTGRVGGRIAEATTPMTEIGGDDEEALWIGDVFGENAAVSGLPRYTQRAHEYRHNAIGVEWSMLHHLRDEGHLHLETMLGLLIAQTHRLERFRGHQFSVHYKSTISWLSVPLIAIY